MTLLAIVIAPGWRMEAAVYSVGSIADLTSKINSANPGDRIILSNGVYTTTGIISITRSGTATQPILIAAQTVGGAEITGRSGFQFNGGSYVTIQGFHFSHTNNNLFVNTNSTHCRITQNTFDLNPISPWVRVYGDDTEVDHNLFRNNTAGQYLQLYDWNSNDDNVAQRMWVHHNHLYNDIFAGANGGESLQLGQGSRPFGSAWVVAEYNLFDQANGDSEVISVKTSDDVIRYNTFINSRGAITLRNQNRCRVEGNFILNSAGIYIYGADALIFNNYLQGATNGIAFGYGNLPEIISSSIGGGTHAVALRARVEFNTLVNCRAYFDVNNGGDSPPYFYPESCTVANNILQGDTNSFVSPLLASHQINFTWQSNIFWGAASTNGSPAGGYLRIDPKLVTNTAAPYHIASDSPAINASYAAPDEVVSDMDGQPRSGTADIGADEYSSASVIRRPLNTNGVGPYVAATNFDIVAMPWSQTVMPGRGTSYTILLSAYNGFTNLVTLTVTNLPAGVSANFNASSISNGYGVSTLSVTASNTTPPGRYTLSVTAASDSFTNTTVACLTVGSLPANWTDVDINSPDSAGSADLFMDSFAVKGGGANISGTSDQFNFAYLPGTSGLTIITARVSTQPNTSTNARSGVMIRESTNANSKYVGIVVTPVAIKMDARPTTGGNAVNLATVSTNAPVGASAPCWVRLVLSGGIFTGYICTNGENWVQLGVTNLTMTNPLVGLAVCAGDNTKLNTSTFDGVDVQPIIITSQPVDQNIVPGNTATFTVGALGSAPLSYQWFFNVTNAVGSNTNILTLTGAQAANAGSYSVVVTSAYGAVTSSVATLIVSAVRTNTYTAAGGTNWICPAGVTAVRVECWGGGGAGGGAQVFPQSGGGARGGGGAGGAYAIYNSYPVVPGNTYYINVGTGGVCVMTDTIRVSGGDSWFSTNNSPSTVIIAKGGAGGETVMLQNTISRYGGGGIGTTSGSSGDVVYAGGSGGTPTTSSVGGSGGGSGGIGSAGNPGSATSGIGATAVTGGGSGGDANAVSGSSGPGQIPDIPPGGGGGGARCGNATSTNLTGGTGSAGQVVLTYTVLAAIFSASPTNGGAPLTVTFTDISTGTITNRYWSFGDGTTMNVTTAGLTHTYSFPGTNTVNLIVSGDGGSSTNTQTNLIVAASVDTVGDGVPDWWRAQYFGGNGATTNGSSSATSDYDNDGVNNLAEYLADTNPTNASSRLAVTGLTIVSNSVRLIWTGGSSAWQFVEYRNSLVDTNDWKAFYTNTPPTAVTNTLFDTGAGTYTSRFYRIKAWR